jgi:regulator of sigma E protease
MTITTILYAILMFCVLVFVHELGHFVAAKSFGIKVNKFALGMGPVLLKKQKGDTEYSLRLFPIGGFCAMEGEDEESDDARAFNNKNAWQKTVVVCAGSLMNLVLAILLMIIVMFYIGSATTTLDRVVPDSPAMEAGLMSGDEIVAIDGNAVERWNDITDYLTTSEAETVTVTVERDGGRLDFVSKFTESDDGRQTIGIVPTLERNPATAVGDGFTATYNMGKMMLNIIRQLFTGEVSIKELSGPVGIVYMTGETVKAGFVNFLYFMALLSLNLAIINMLPLPALDGGRLLFIIARKITGKAITDDMEGKIHFIGIMLLFGLMIYVTWNDITRFIVPFFQ